MRGAGAPCALREKEAELEVARLNAVELEWLQLAASNTQAWCDLARSNEATASGLRAMLDTLLQYNSSIRMELEESSPARTPRGMITLVMGSHQNIDKITHVKCPVLVIHESSLYTSTWYW